MCLHIYFVYFVSWQSSNSLSSILSFSSSSALIKKTWHCYEENVNATAFLATSHFNKDRAHLIRSRFNQLKLIVQRCGQCRVQSAQGEKFHWQIGIIQFDLRQPRHRVICLSICNAFSYQLCAVLPVHSPLFFHFMSPLRFSYCFQDI